MQRYQISAWSFKIEACISMKDKPIELERIRKLKIESV